jgi:hypothetical protein
MSEIMRSIYKKSNTPQNIGILLPKLFIIIIVLLLMWLVVVGSASMILEFDPLWTGISVGNWALVISALIGVFIVLDIVLYVKSEGPTTTFEVFQPITQSTEPEFKDGKRVYIFTYPVESKGGIYSKTYLEVDATHILRIRNQMFSSEDLWQEDEVAEPTDQ